MGIEKNVTFPAENLTRFALLIKEKYVDAIFFFLF